MTKQMWLSSSVAAIAILAAGTAQAQTAEPTTQVREHGCPGCSG